MGATETHHRVGGGVDGESASVPSRKLWALAANAHLLIFFLFIFICSVKRSEAVADGSRTWIDVTAEQRSDSESFFR